VLHALQTVQLTVVFRAVAMDALVVVLLYALADVMAVVDPWIVMVQIIM
jgi:hypothetical protein